ncbi:MAG TPA: prepilin peptidase [Rhizomicrobium sp.]
MLAEFVVLVLLPGLLVAAASWDAASFTIPNFIPLALIASFALLIFAGHMTPAIFGGHLLAGFIGLIAGFTLFALGYVGGGDAKLFAATALMLGLDDLPRFALIASVFGGGLTLSLLMMRKMPLPRAFAAQGWIARLHDDREGIPYGIALALGALVILPYTDLFRLATGG